MAAMVAVAVPCVDVRVLRIRPQCLSERGVVSEILHEVRIGRRREAERSELGQVPRLVEIERQGVAVLLQNGKRELVIVQQARLQMCADYGVIAEVEDERVRQLPLYGEI